jgi:hypothetical protein
MIFIRVGSYKGIVSSLVYGLTGICFFLYFFLHLQCFWFFICIFSLPQQKASKGKSAQGKGEEIRISDLRFIRRGPQSVELSLKNKIREFFEIDKRHEQNQREMRNFCE